MSEQGINKDNTLNQPANHGILQGSESPRGPRPRENSRVHFDALSGGISTEYIPVGNDVWEEFAAGNDNNSTLPSSQAPKSHGDDDKIAGTNDGAVEKDDYLANFREESLSSDEDCETDAMLPENGVVLSSSHVFSSLSPLPSSRISRTGYFIKLDERQKLLFSAVEENDLERVRGLMCGEDPPPDVNGINPQGRSPLIVAIRAKHLDMIMLLLQCGAAVGDALLHAVETGSPAIVRLICSFLKGSKLALKTTLDGFAFDTSFLPCATPLMYAAKINNHDMVKDLVAFGAELPTLEAVLSRITSKTTYEFSLARLFWHQAISSEAYLLYDTEDPVQAAFNSGRIIKKCEEEQLPHLKEGYNQLMKDLDRFITRYLEMARNSGEISTLLCEEEPRAVPRKERQSTLPQRVQDALVLKYKQVIANPNCMHFVLDQWYHPNWQDLNLIRFFLWTLLIVIAQPIVCICYIALPIKIVMRSMKTPYVRFLMHWSSRLCFIAIIMGINYWTGEYNLASCEKIKEFATERTTRPIVWILYMWIVGLTWREMKEVWNQGIRCYLKDVFNLIDCVQITLYWCSIITGAMAYTDYGSKFNCVQPTTTGDTEPVPITPDDVTYAPVDSYTWSDDDIKRNDSAFEEHTLWLTIGPNSVWRMEQYDPLLLSEAAFSVATVLSFLSLLRDIVVFSFVGPLRVSLGGMIADIVRFVFLFTFVWVSFGIGMTHLYQTFIMTRNVSCKSEPGCDEPHMFENFITSMGTLFWSLFGPLDFEGLKTDGLQLTGSVGLALYAAYMTVAAVVMLNALIAMMSNTYTRVEQNSEMEWRVARTNMMAEYMTKSATLPPPFNVVPTLKTLKKMIIEPYYWFHGDARRRRQMEKAAAANSRGRRQGKYKIFMREMTERYIMEIEMVDDEDATQKMKEEVTSLHESLLAMRNEIHDIRTENVELCDTVKDLCRLLRRSTTSVSMQTTEDGLPLGMTPFPLSQRKKKSRSLGKKISRYVGSKTHKK